MKHCWLCSWIAKKKWTTKQVEVGSCCSPTLALSSALKMWLDDTNEMCWQGLNLSSTTKLAFHNDLALLQQTIICSSIKWKHKHPGMIGWSQVKHFQHQNGVKSIWIDCQACAALWALFLWFENCTCHKLKWVISLIHLFCWNMFYSQCV